MNGSSEYQAFDRIRVGLYMIHVRRSELEDMYLYCGSSQSGSCPDASRRDPSVRARLASDWEQANNTPAFTAMRCPQTEVIPTVPRRLAGARAMTNPTALRAPE